MSLSPLQQPPHLTRALRGILEGHGLREAFPPEVDAQARAWARAPGIREPGSSPVGAAGVSCAPCPPARTG